MSANMSSEGAPTRVSEGVQANVGPIRVSADLGGIRVEAGAEEAVQTPWEEKREKEREKRERLAVNAGDVAKEKEAAKKDEKLTNKYEDGVGQVVDYFQEVFGNPDNGGAIEDAAAVYDALSAAGIDLPSRAGETPEAYARRAAEVVFHETRLTRYGEGTVAASGDVRETKKFGRVAWRGFRLKRQIAATRTAMREWRDQMGNRKDAHSYAAIVGRIELNRKRIVIEAGPEVYGASAQGIVGQMQRLLEGVPQGENLVNPLGDTLGRFFRQPGEAEVGEPPADIVGGLREQYRQNQRIGAQVRDAIGGVVGRLLPDDMYSRILGADRNISSVVEGLMDVASQTPEAVFRAHEALLDLQALSQALLKISGGKLNIMLQLNKLVAEKTNGTVSVTDMLRATEPMADAYLAANPDQGIRKLLGDARRDRIARGGDTVAQRAFFKTRYGLALVDPLTGSTLRKYQTEVGARDIYAEEEQAAPTAEYKPKIWDRSPKAEAWRAAEKQRKEDEEARKKAAKRLPSTFQTAAAAAEEVARIREGIKGGSPEAVADMLQRVAEEETARLEAEERRREQATQPVPPTPEELEATTRKQEDADLEAARKRVDQLMEAADVELRRPRPNVARANELSGQIIAANATLTDLQRTINARRNPPPPSNP